MPDRMEIITIQDADGNYCKTRIWYNLCYHFGAIYQNGQIASRSYVIFNDINDEIAKYSGTWYSREYRIEFSDREKYTEFLLKWG